MIKRYSQIYQPKQNPKWNACFKLQEAFISMWTQIKQSSYISKYKEPSRKFLKLVDQFTYLGSNISSTESDANIYLTKVWNAFDRLSNILKSYQSDPSDKTKLDFFQSVSKWLYGCTIWTLAKYIEKSLEGNYTRILHTVLNKSWN